MDAYTTASELGNATAALLGVKGACGWTVSFDDGRSSVLDLEAGVGGSRTGLRDSGTGLGGSRTGLGMAG